MMKNYHFPALSFREVDVLQLLCFYDDSALRDLGCYMSQLDKCYDLVHGCVGPWIPVDFRGVQEGIDEM